MRKLLGAMAMKRQILVQLKRCLIMLSMAFIIIINMRLVQYIGVRQDTQSQRATGDGVHHHVARNVQTIMKYHRDVTNLSSRDHGSPPSSTPPSTLPISDFSTRASTKSLNDTIVPKRVIFGTLRCPKNRRPTPDVIMKTRENEQGPAWQDYNYSPDGRVFVYSAYYDDRPAAGLLPTVRLLVLLANNGYFRLRCHLWYESQEEPYIVDAISNVTGLNQLLTNPFIFEEFTITCPLPAANPVPTHVSILRHDAACGNTSHAYKTFIAVRHSVRRDKPQHQFGVCVTNGYGVYKTVEEIVEWVEMHHLLGVSEIHLYDSGYRNLTAVIDYYSKTTKTMTVKRIPHPLGSEGVRTDGVDLFTVEQIRNLRTTSLNDCMMRHMYRYRWLVVVDLDEVIVPRHKLNYAEMMVEIDARLQLTSPYHSYTFTNMYFLDDFPPEHPRPSNKLRMMRYRNRAAPSDAFVGAKSFVDPLRCFNLFNHYCITRFGVEQEGLYPSAVVPSVVANSHHYRSCGSFFGVTCKQLYEQKVRDDVVLKFEVGLGVRVKRVLEDLKVNVVATT